MILYLMRHANAGTARENPLLDNRRALIKEGKEQCMLMARMLSSLKVQIDQVVSSPLKRSLQTAQFVATELGFEGGVQVSQALKPGADFDEFQEMLAHYSGFEGVLVVGHNPNLFLFLGKLITGNGGAAIRLRKGSIARVDMDHHPPRLQWLLDPRTVRQIYSSVGKSSRPKTSRK
jgi:phosphohistidine phosphatase